MSQQRHAPLDRQISAGKLKAEGKLRKIRSNDDDDDDDGINMSAEYVDPKTSRKIMQQAQAQREELATTNHDSTSSTSPLSSMKARTPRPRAGLGVNLMVGAQHEENSDEEEMTFTLLNSFWFMIASLLQQGTDLLPRYLHNKAHPNVLQL